MAGYFEKGVWVMESDIPKTQEIILDVAVKVDDSQLDAAIEKVTRLEQSAEYFGDIVILPKSAIEYREKHMNRMRDLIRFYRGMGVWQRLIFLLSPGHLRK